MVPALETTGAKTKLQGFILNPPKGVGFLAAALFEQFGDIWQNGAVPQAARFVAALAKTHVVTEFAFFKAIHALPPNHELMNSSPASRVWRPTVVATPAEAIVIRVAAPAYRVIRGAGDFPVNLLPAWLMRHFRAVVLGARLYCVTASAIRDSGYRDLYLPALRPSHSCANVFCVTGSAVGGGTPTVVTDQAFVHIRFALELRAFSVAYRAVTTCAIVTQKIRVLDAHIEFCHNFIGHIGMALKAGIIVGRAHG